MEIDLCGLMLAPPHAIRPPRTMKRLCIRRSFQYDPDKLSFCAYPDS